MSTLGVCRDVRTLTAALAELTGQAVRERFARLNQMLLLLTVDTLSEVGDLWSDSSMTWRLSAMEVRTVLSSRSDLDRAAIAALPLD